MAKKFVFRLDPILKIRAHKVKEAKNALRQVANLRGKKEIEIAKKEKYFDILLKNKTIHKKVNAHDLQSEDSHKIFIKEEIIKLETEKRQLLEIESLRRSKLNEAMKEEKILEKLKEKKHIYYLENLEKEEQKVIDEIARNRHGSVDTPTRIKQ